GHDADQPAAEDVAGVVLADIDASDADRYRPYGEQSSESPIEEVERTGNPRERSRVVARERRIRRVMDDQMHETRVSDKRTIARPDQAGDDHVPKEGET